MLAFVYKIKIKTATSIAIAFFILVILIQGSLAIYNINDSRKSAMHLSSVIISKDTETISELFSRIDSLTTLMETDEYFIYRPSLVATNDIVKDSKQFNNLHQKFQTMVSNSASNSSFFNAFLFLEDSLPLTYITPDYGKKIDLNHHSATSNVYSLGSIKHTDWVKRLYDSTNSLIWVDKVNNRNILCFAKKISMHIVEHSEIKHYPLGVFYVSYDLSSLLSQLELREMYQTSTITFLYNNKIIYNTAGEGASFFDKEPITHTSSIYPGLTLVTQISKSDINAPFTRQIIVGIVMISLTIILGLVALLYINGTVISPITRMANHLLDDERSKLNYTENLNPEIAVLYKNHNYMVEHTKKAMDESRKSYYKMLQAQINPHFTYNVLNTISALSLVKGDFEIAETLSNLVSMIRYGINSPDTLAKLEEEVEIIKKFVSIQNFRYNNNIIVNYQIPESILHVKMPKLTLQPLIENSIFHSDSNLAIDNIIINFSAELSDNKIIIKISDNNAVPPKKLNEYLLSNTDEIIENRRGLGIRNINQRLSFVFGEEYGLSYISENEKLCAVITIPAS